MSVVSVMDIVDQKTRSQMMSGIRNKDTKPEISIRKRLYAAGYRYRLHIPELPGKPDIVLPRYNTVIFIHGCFWHHHGCALFKLPQTRTDFWKKKLEGNRERDILNVQRLAKMSWRVVSVYECAWRFTGSNKESEFDKISIRIIRFLNNVKSQRLTIEGKTTKG